MSEEVNPSVMSTIANLGLSPELSGIVGAPPNLPPLPMNGGNRKQPMPPPPALGDPLSAAQQREFVKDAASGRGYSNLAAKKFSALAPLLPGAERVRIRKRRSDGSLATVKDYGLRDVEQQGDIEAFVDMYLRPTYGGGDYQVALIDNAGREFNGGTVSFMGAAIDPDTKPVAAVDPAGGLMPLMVEMYRKSTQTSPVPDPFTQFRQMKELTMEMAPKQADQTGMFAAVLQMQQAAAAQNQQMLMTLMAPKPQDDRLLAMLERMDRRLEKLETSPPPPPPMMPVAPAGPNTAELITAIAGAAGVLLPLIKGDGVKVTEMAALMLQAQQAAQPKDQLGVRDVIAIFKDKEQAQSGPATLEEQITTLVRVKELAAAISPPTQGPQGTTFWDAMVSILGPSSEIARAIGGRVEAGMGQQQPQHINVDTLRPATQHPHTGPQMAPDAEPEVQLPPDFKTKCAAIESATGPGERVTATIEALMSLREIPQWAPFIQNLLTAVAKNDKEASMRLLGSWLKMVADRGFISNISIAAETLKTFHGGFEFIRAGLLEKVPMLRGIAQQADEEAVARAQAQAPAPAAAAPSPVEAAPEVPAVPQKPFEVPAEGIATGPAPATIDFGHDAQVAAFGSEAY